MLGIIYTFRYVALCAGIKIVALAIFLFDWYLIKRRKNLDEARPMTTNDMVGSIISLDKRKYFCLWQ